MTKPNLYPLAKNLVWSLCSHKGEIKKTEVIKMAKTVKNTKRKLWIEKTKANVGSIVGYTILIVFSISLLVVAFLSISNLS
jgi:hypothetical protein